jgi:glycosyltransferase involved in cell wall biosynthesis
VTTSHHDADAAAGGIGPDAVGPDAVGPNQIDTDGLDTDEVELDEFVLAGTKYKLLSVVVPVFNERNTVAEIIRRIRAVELPIPLEVVVVDDGSSDGSDKVLAALQDSTVRVIRHPGNRGKGAAVRTGIEAAKGDLVLIQDADLEYDPDDWPSLLAPVLRGKARVVYGSRFTGERKNMLISHWIGNRLLTLVTNLLYKTTLSDMETCYKLFDRTVLDKITIESNRFEFEPEITAKVLLMGERIYEVPISYAGREISEGKKITWRDGWGALGTLVRYRLRRQS